MFAELLPYYQRELFFLRELGAEFAARHKNVAARLQIEGDQYPDPHVERLIEAFAFLTSRVHKKLDDEFPLITDALLGVLYPHLQRPVPSMSIVHFQLDPANPQITERYPIDRGIQLYTRDTAGSNGMACTFRTCYPVEIWPVHVVDARVELAERSEYRDEAAKAQALAVLRIGLETIGDMSFASLNPRKLRLFIDAEGTRATSLFELIHNSVSSVLLAGANRAKEIRGRLTNTCIQPVGFAEDEGMLPYDLRSFMGYRLLHEYFTYPEKFMFFDLLLDEKLKIFNVGKKLEVVLLLSAFDRPERLADLVREVNRDTFKLGCTPIVNVFKHYGDPIRVVKERSEYPVIPDARRPRGMEVYSIEKVEKTTKSGGHEEVVTYHPFFSHKHVGPRDAPKSYWIASRYPSFLRDDKGTNVNMTLIDLNFEHSVPDAETLSLTLLCTNRDLPALLPFGGRHGEMSIEGASAVSRIRLLRKPSTPVRLELRKGSVWRLISHLTLNHLSLVSQGRDALQEMLNLYNFANSDVVREQIAGIVAVKSEPAVARVGSPQFSSFVRGTDVTLTFNENVFTDSGSPYLFAMVMERFFGLYCAPNSFVRLAVNIGQNEKEFVKWPPRAGEAVLL